MMLALKRQKKMIGIGEQFEYIMRDESLHLAFGCDLINTIKAENPDVWTQQFQDELIALIEKAVVLERTMPMMPAHKDYLASMQNSSLTM